jgi:hypothetical protein
MAKKVSARGSRKSIVAQYKAKAKGKPGKSKKPVKRKKTIVKKVERPMEMIIGESTYSVGDVAWYVDERSTLVHPRPYQADITAVYPDDSVEPAVGVREYETGKHRAIRARLIGWTKSEAKAQFELFKAAEKTK